MNECKSQSNKTAVHKVHMGRRGLMIFGFSIFVHYMIETITTVAIQHIVRNNIEIEYTFTSISEIARNSVLCE